MPADPADFPKSLTIDYVRAWDSKPSAAIPGDLDFDGDVDDADLGTNFANYTGPLGPGIGGRSLAQGDTDGEGDVDDADLGSAFTNYTGPLTPNVPESGGLAVLGVGLGMLVRGRRTAPTSSRLSGL